MRQNFIYQQFRDVNPAETSVFPWNDKFPYQLPPCESGGGGDGVKVLGIAVLSDNNTGEITPLTPVGIYNIGTAEGLPAAATMQQDGETKGCLTTVTLNVKLSNVTPGNFTPLVGFQLFDDDGSILGAFDGLSQTYSAKVLTGNSTVVRMQFSMYRAAGTDALQILGDISGLAIEDGSGLVSIPTTYPFVDLDGALNDYGVFYNNSGRYATGLNYAFILGGVGGNWQILSAFGQAISYEV